MTRTEIEARIQELEKRKASLDDLSGGEARKIRREIRRYKKLLDGPTEVVANSSSAAKKIKKTKRSRKKKEKQEVELEPLTREYYLDELQAMGLSLQTYSAELPAVYCFVLDIICKGRISAEDLISRFKDRTSQDPEFFVVIEGTYPMIGLGPILTE